MSFDQRLPAHSPSCMGCGSDNPSGLQLEVYRHDDHVYADLTFDERQSGAPGLAHGGAISAACDDIMGFTLWIARTPAVTRTLTVEYRHPVPLHTPVHLVATVVDNTARALSIKAVGTVGKKAYFTANAVFVKVDLSHFQNHGDPDAATDLITRFLQAD